MSRFLQLTCSTDLTQVPPELHGQMRGWTDLEIRDTELPTFTDDVMASVSNQFMETAHACECYICRLIRSASNPDNLFPPPEFKVVIVPPKACGPVGEDPDA